MPRAPGSGRLLLAAVLTCGVPLGVAAQSGCRFAEDGNDLFVATTLPTGDRVTNVTNPHFLCEDGVEIWADSAVTYSAQAMSQLIGSVRYRDRARELSADQARYFSNVGRLQAQGRVHVTNRDDGSEIENGDLVYLREADYRPEEEMTVTTGADGLRPRALVQPEAPDSAAATTEPAAPYTVVGDRIVLRGSSYFSATGNVEIERDSLFAFADSSEYEQASDRLVLVGAARVESGTYTLVGRTITLGTDPGAVTEIQALRDALLTGEDIVLTAPHITLRVADGVVERLVAVPLTPTTEDGQGPAADSADATRPVATAEGFELTADSLELVAPADVVERIFAAGQARSVSRSRDSLNVEGLPEFARYDWLEGDTVVVSLRHLPDSALASTDSAGGGYEVDRIVARVAARSLYRLPPEDSTAQIGVDPPAVHYVIGDEITIVMDLAGEVEVMEVKGQTRGVHLEPVRSGPSDTLPDTLGALADTTTASLADDDPGPGAPPTRPAPGGTPPAHGADPWTRP